MAAVVTWEWLVLLAFALVVMALTSGTQRRRGGRTRAGSPELQPVPVRVEEAGRRR